MITVKNYKEKTKGLDFSTMPDVLGKSDKNFDSLVPLYGKNETITKVLDLYLEKLNEYLKKESRKQEDKNKVKTEVKAKTEVLDYLDILEKEAQAFIRKPFSYNSFLNEFGTDFSVKTPIGIAYLDYEQFEKIDEKGRERYFGLIRPTLSKPILIIEHKGKQLFIKSFIDKKRGILYFFSVTKDKNGEIKVVSNHEKTKSSLKNKLKEGDVRYISSEKNLGSIYPMGKAEIHPKEYITVSFGIPLTFTKVKKKTKKVNTKSKNPKQEPKKVESVGLELKFIKRYYLLHNKKKSKKQILVFLASLQNAILTKQIRKTSPFAKEIEHIQDELLSLLSFYGKDEDSVLDITIKEKTYNQYKALANSEKVMDSVRIIARYNRLQGKSDIKLKAKALLKTINNALEKDKIQHYTDEVAEVKKALETYLNNRDVLEFNDVSLNGYTDEQVFQYLLDNAISVDSKKYSKSNFKNLIKGLKTPIGEIRMSKANIVALTNKFENKGRKRYFSFIEPTLKKPLLIIKDTDDNLVFVKTFISSKDEIFISVLRQNEKLRIITLSPKNKENIVNLIERGDIVSPEHFLSGIGSPSTVGYSQLHLKQQQKIELRQYSIVEINLPFNFVDENTATNIQTLNNKTKSFSNPIVSSSDFKDVKFNNINFTGKWLSLIGKPSKPFAMMTWAKAGQGKSTMNLQLAHYLASKHNKKVLYVPDEEKLGYTLQEKLERLNAFHDNLFISEDIPNNLKMFDFVFLDSINSMGLTPEDLKELRTKNPQTSFLYIFQATKDGKFKGSSEYGHDVDVVINVDKGLAVAEKSRFGGTGEVKIF